MIFVHRALRSAEGEPAPADLVEVAGLEAAGPAAFVVFPLPDAPFLLGELDPAQILAPYVAGPVTVDNGVNWAAQAERDHARAAVPDDFTYLFLGAGLGCAVVSDGQVRRGHGGLAGEVAHLMTAGPRGQAMPFIEVFGELGLRQAVSGVLAAVVALTDPGLIIVGGSWGRRPVILKTIVAGAARLPRAVPVRGAELTGNPSLAGARADALSRLREAIMAGPRA